MITLLGNVFALRHLTCLSYLGNSPFPSSGLPLCQNESKCKTILMKMCFTFKFIFIQIKLISYEKFCTRTRFETEANQNSEMGYWPSVRLILLAECSGRGGMTGGARLLGSRGGKRAQSEIYKKEKKRQARGRN